MRGGGQFAGQIGQLGESAQDTELSCLLIGSWDLGWTAGLSDWISGLGPIGYVRPRWRILSRDRRRGVRLLTFRAQARNQVDRFAWGFNRRTLGYGIRLGQAT